MPPHDLIDDIKPVEAEKEQATDDAPVPKEKSKSDDDATHMTSPTFVAADVQGVNDGSIPKIEAAQSTEFIKQGDEEKEAENTDALTVQDNAQVVETGEQTRDNEEQETQPKRRFGERMSNLRKRISERRASAAAASLASEAAATQSAKEEKGKEPSAVEKEMERLQEGDLEAMRAAKISVTVVKTEGDSYGFALIEEQEDDDKKPATVKIDLLVEEGLLYKSPLKVGDKLVTVNNKKVANCDQVKDDLVAIDGPVTLVVETPQGNPSVVHAFCQKPEKDSVVGIGFHVLEHGEHRLLQINYLDSNGLLAYSALSQGDLVLAINDVPCAEKSPEEAAALILESTSTVTILALNPTLAGRQHGVGTRAQRWMRSAKRAGIAIGGGTMVGVGLIFIPTLPPPFGEVLIVGGVSVLGTEFEAPKRLMRSTRDSLERAVGRNEATEEGGSEVGENSVAASAQSVPENTSQVADETEVNDEDAMAAAVASTLPSSSNNTNSPQKKTMKDKMKSFGRNYVLPFLDQVVGDHKNEQSPATEGEDAPNLDGQSSEETTAEAGLSEDEKAAAKFHAQNHDAVSESESPTGGSDETEAAEVIEAKSDDRSDAAASVEPTPVSTQTSD
ncbi:MAG: hypothetical protein SGILL_005143 [Bacillariaceae sp.]